MPRRPKKQGISAGQTIGIAAAVVGFAVAAFLVFKIVAGGSMGGSSGSSIASDLNVYQYLENATSLRGNNYRIEGSVSELLRATDDGRLISFDVSGAGGAAPVPVFVPREQRQINIERGANFTILVKVERGGLLVAESIN